MSDIAPAADQAVRERARVRTMVERRRRVLRNLVIFALITTAMLFTALAQRDVQAMRGARAGAELVRSALHDAFTEQGRPPLRIPDLGPEHRPLIEDYSFNLLYADASRTIKPVLVCWSREPIGFFLREDGRFVLLFDGQTYTTTWMRESDFQQQAGRLGAGGHGTS